jgi:hypothetical protein
MIMPNPSIQFALFEDLTSAELAVATLQEMGLSTDQIELTTMRGRPLDEPPRRGKLESWFRRLIQGAQSDIQRLSGRLVDLGVPEEDARYYRAGLNSGKVLLIVISMRRGIEAGALLAEHGGERPIAAQLDFSGGPV